MADEQYTWLNRETAERLLRGESLEAVDSSARDQAERLSRALGALSAEAAPAPGELPGEQAALAAFRKAREAAEAERTAAAHAPTAPRTPARGADAGLVRIGAPARTGIRTRRPRWARPVRLALAAAVAAGTLGGVAVAAGTGVLPTPFGDDHPRPATSVSPDTTTGQPLTSPSAPDGGTRGHRGGTDDEAAGTDDGTGAPSATSGAGRPGATAACRALRDGKDLDTGRKRALEHLAGGPGRVTAYCKVLLGTGDSASGGTGGANSGGSGGNTTGQGSDNGKGGGKGSGKDNGKGNGNGKGGDDGPADPDGGKGSGKGGGNGNGGDNGKGSGNGEDKGKGSGNGEGNGKGGGRQHGGADLAPPASAPAHRGAPGNGSAPPSPTPAYTAH
ncbi:hypothetical protein ACFYPB_07895 [Streptomyces olivaceoviridis]|uniref:hypothetical protein n=1 Tax=Streptomyces olivaceoviridis TaxID=1921 RepID=UPI0036B52ED3